MSHIFITKRVILVYLFAICFCVNAFGYEEHVADSLTVSRLYGIDDMVNPCEIRFNTEERTVQSHDGQHVFCNKRHVEYRITRTDGKFVIKRNVVSSETVVLCEDKALQMIYPNVTSKQLCGLLKPGKMKEKDMFRSKLEYSISKSGDDYVLVLNKIGKLSVREDAFMGETVSYDKITEELNYTSSDGKISLDVINKVVSDIRILVTRKNGSRHHVELVENVVVLR